MTLTVFRTTIQVYLIFSPMIRMSVVFGTERKITEVNSHFDYFFIKALCFQNDLIVLSDFSTVNLLVFPSLLSILFGRKSLYTAHISGMGVMFHLLEEQSYESVLCFFSLGMSTIYSFPFVYTHQFISIDFKLWIRIQFYFILLSKVFQLWH